MGGYDGHRGWVYSVAVRPPERRKGVGTALLRRLEEALAALAVPWDQRAGQMAESLAESPEDYWHTRARLPWN